VNISPVVFGLVVQNIDTNPSKKVTEETKEHIKAPQAYLSFIFNPPGI